MKNIKKRIEYSGENLNSIRLLPKSIDHYLTSPHSSWNDYAFIAKKRQIRTLQLSTLIDHWDDKWGTLIEVDHDFIVVKPKGRFKKWKADLDIERIVKFEHWLSYKKGQGIGINSDRYYFTDEPLLFQATEPMGKEFLAKMIEFVKDCDWDSVLKLARETVDAIKSGEAIFELAQTDILRDPVEAYRKQVRNRKRSRSAGYEVALKSRKKYLGGDHLSYYICGNRAEVNVPEHARMLSNWSPEKNNFNYLYYLKRFRTWISKYQSLIPEELFSQLHAMSLEKNNHN